MICRPSLTMSGKTKMSLRPRATQQLIKEFLSYMGNHTCPGCTPCIRATNIIVFPGSHINHTLRWVCLFGCLGIKSVPKLMLTSRMYSYMYLKITPALFLLFLWESDHEV